MKITRLMLAFSALLILGLVPWAAAQMMGGGQDHASMNKTDSPNESGMMANMGTMMGDMSEKCKMMSNTFSDLETNFEKMMQMDDMPALKVEMKKHLGMMQEMHKGMMKQRTMCQDMMSKMGSGGMNGMMGMGGNATDSSGEHSSHHK